jgi:hypothetical protein
MTQPPAVIDKPTPPPAQPPRVKPPIRRTAGTILGFLSLGAAAGIVVLGLTIGIYIFQDAYQAGHQTSPTNAVDGLLDATFNKRDTSAISKYLCGDPVTANKVKATISQINKFEKSNPDVFLTYRWDITKKSQNGDQAVVTANVQAKTTVNNSAMDNPPQLWTFGMRNKSGWKVCSLQISG